MHQRRLLTAWSCTGAQVAGPAGGDGQAESGTATIPSHLADCCAWQPVPMEDEARMTEHSDTVMEELKVRLLAELGSSRADGAALQTWFEPIEKSLAQNL